MRELLIVILQICIAIYGLGYLFMGYKVMSKKLVIKTNLLLLTTVLPTVFLSLFDILKGGYLISVIAILYIAYLYRVMNNVSEIFVKDISIYNIDMSELIERLKFGLITRQLSHTVMGDDSIKIVLDDVNYGSIEIYELKGIVHISFEAYKSEEFFKKLYDTTKAVVDKIKINRRAHIGVKWIVGGLAIIVLDICYTFIR